MANPTLLRMPLCVNADKNTIPITDAGTSGLFSEEKGFQAINSLPLTAGGKAPARQDFNGIFALLGGIVYMTQRGYTFEWDATLPYVVGCIVRDTDGKLYRCINDVAAGGTQPSIDYTNWQPYDLYDVLASGFSHNGNYRGKNLGTWTSVAKVEAFLTAHNVYTGKFDDLFLGDYVSIQDGTYNKEWEIAGFNHYYDTGSDHLSTNHIVLFPKTNLTTSYMNSTNTTAGGYAGSYLHTTVIPAINTKLTNVLGSHLLTRQINLSSSVGTSLPSMAGAGMTGASTNFTTVNVQACLPSEIEVYGTTVYSSSFYDLVGACRKLPLFNFKSSLHKDGGYWLTAVASSTHFASSNQYGFASYAPAGQSGGGVSPIICVG